MLLYRTHIKFRIITSTYENTAEKSESKNELNGSDFSFLVFIL